MILIADLETNSLNPSVIWVVGVLDFETDEFTSYTHPEGNVAEGLLRLLEADLVVFHNGKGYDVPVIKRLTEGLVEIPEEKIVDTLELSRKMVKMKNHGLEAWGEIFDLNKTKDTIPNFDCFWPQMVPYCERDCRITKKLFELILELGGG